jgi:predicted SAM-dependent methyltransferase
MEHFTEAEIADILGEFHRVLKPSGKIILFWPPGFGLSVIFLKIVHFVFNRVLNKQIELHPPEITRVKNRTQIEVFLRTAGFSTTEFSFGPRDLFTYAIIVGLKGKAN